MQHMLKLHLVLIFSMKFIGGAPEQAASQRRDVAGSKLVALSQAPSPGPRPPAPSPSPSKGENGVLGASHATQNERAVSEHIVCVLFCVSLLAARVEEGLIVGMGSQAAYAARALRQPRPPLRGHIFYWDQLKFPQ